MNEGSENHAEAGRRGEDIALQALRDKGYTLIARNRRLGRGEIDLIVEDSRGVLVFVEVKSNRTNSKGLPLERVDKRKILQLQRMAERYCRMTGNMDRDMRFDVVGVDLSRSEPHCEHIEGAFLPDASGYFLSR